jgi:C-22 sterol desaturase
MHLASTLGTAAVQMDWKHHRTDRSDEVQVIAAIFPLDGCILEFSKKSNA